MYEVISYKFKNVQTVHTDCRPNAKLDFNLCSTGGTSFSFEATPGSIFLHGPYSRIGPLETEKSRRNAQVFTVSYSITYTILNNSF